MTEPREPYLPLTDDLHAVVIGLDPGPERSAWCALNGAGDPLTWSILPNAQAVNDLRLLQAVDPRAVLCVEMVASYGMPVGASIFETCVWIGRFLDAWEAAGGRTDRLTRIQIKSHLCHSAKACDSNIRWALIDLYGGNAAIGTKRLPGPLYGIKRDGWAALAVARTWLDLH